MHTIKYSRYPNNEIRAVHYYTPQKKNPKELPPVSSELPPAGDSAQIPSAPQSDPPLDISSDFEKLPKKSGYGGLGKRTEFGLNARRSLLRAGGALDRSGIPAAELVFLTGTIPGGTPDAFDAMARYSAFTIKRLKDWVNNYAPAKYDFYVWELQARGALHLHYCVHIPDASNRAYVLQAFREQWERILDGIQADSGVDMWKRRDGSYHREGRSVLQAYSQVVHTSVAAYLAGYCAGEKGKHQKDAASPYYPVRWWGMSRALTSLLREMSSEITVEFSSYKDARHEILCYYEDMENDAAKVYRYQHKAGIGSSVVSYHPQDNGENQWQKTVALHQPLSETQRFCYGIQALRAFVAACHGSIAESIESGLPWGFKLASVLRLCSLLKTYSESTSDRVLFRTVLSSASDLYLNQVEALFPPRLQKLYRSGYLWVCQNRLRIRFDARGMVSNPEDLIYDIDLQEIWGYTHTSDEDTNGEGEASAKLPSPPPLPEQLNLF